MPCFHLAFPVADLEATREFYVNYFGCEIGRASDHSIVFNFFGHQVVAHLAPDEAPINRDGITRNQVDSKHVPVRHFGMVLAWDDWQALSKRLQEYQIDFVIEPYIRYEGTSGEQATMFLLDPSGNALEFKAFKQEAQAFLPWEQHETELA